MKDEKHPQEETTNKAKKSIYVLLDSDVEDILLNIDDLYWRLLNLTRKRAFGINFDPQELARKMRGESLEE